MVRKVGGVCRRQRTPAAIGSGCDKALKVLQDFTPSWNIRTGAEELYEAYVKTGITLEEFEGPRYKRVAHIKLLLEQGILNEDLRHAAGQIPVQTDELIAAQ